MTFPHPALLLASNDHESFRAALALLRSGKAPADVTAEALTQERQRMNRRQSRDELVAQQTALCWEHREPPALPRLIELLQNDQINNAEAMELFQLYPGQKVL